MRFAAHRLTIPIAGALALALGLGAALAAPAAAQEAPKKVASVEGITEYRLPNGLQVLLFPDESKPKVTVALTIFVGSRHEGYGETGMAHLLEHMVFKGTPTHPDIPGVFKERGAQFNDLGLVYDAAASGFGVALVRAEMAAAWFDSGRLVRLSSRTAPSPHANYICWRPGALERWECAAFVDWLLHRDFPPGREKISNPR